MIRYESHAPARIDLAGGTIDIWPIYLLVPGSRTVNIGVDLFASAALEIDETPTPGLVSLQSGDQGAALELSWDKILADTQVGMPPALDLHARLLRHFARKRDPKQILPAIKLSTRAKSPAGAGLGGSSTLAVALTGVLAAWAEDRVTIDPETHGERFIGIVRDIETQVLRVPAGVQDYYGAMFGGLQSIAWGPEQHRRRQLPWDIAQEVAKRTLLFYSGKSRNSGINNWVLFKEMIDGSVDVLRRFESIAASARDLEEALLKKDWRAAGAAIRAEWSVRKTLATGICTPELEDASRAALDCGGSAIKVCGAGGGGCFFVYLDDTDPQRRERVIETVTRSGTIRHLDYQPSPHGLDVTIADAS